MKIYTRPVMTIGLALPLVLTAVLVGACGYGYWFFHKTLREHTKIYVAIQKYKAELPTVNEEEEFLDGATQPLADTRQMGNFISYIQSAANAEKGIKVVGVDQMTSAIFYDREVTGRQIVLEGLSGPVIPIFGEGLKRYPTIVSDAWHIEKTADGKNLEFRLNASFVVKAPEKQP